MLVIIGNTFPHKDSIKAAGARWNGERKAWTAEDDNKAVAKLLVGLVGPAFRSAAQRDQSGNVVVVIPKPRASTGRGGDYDQPITHTFRRPDGSTGSWTEY